ncbi:MAG: class I SAM-dependent methyltransferase [Acidobacteriia bacterium]|nr:class I SAM-dependent methyltransferase [Terriglobia bacterium]
MSSSSAVSTSGPKPGRLSNGLKEFLFQLDGIGRGHLLDMGPARQTTLNFFIERGFKVYTDDLLMTWKIFLDADEQRKKELAPDADRSLMTPAARAERFLETTLQYPEGTFDAVLLWDILDYLDTELMTRLAARLTSLVREGGVVFAIFHARKPEMFHRYRVMDAQNLELIPATSPFAPQRVFQNREISDLFRRYRSSKTFVGRDQLREGLFVK